MSASPGQDRAPGSAAQVFVSYARSTAGLARRVADALRAEGFDVWRDDDLPPHRPYEEVIQERLDGAAAVLVLWSREAVRSQWVRSEANRAREQGKLVQAMVDPAPLPMPFDQIQYANLTGWNGDAAAPAWRKVTASIRELLVLNEETAVLAPHAVSPRPRALRNRLVWIAGAAALVCAAAVAAFALAPLLNSTASIPPRSVAVLPIRNLSGDASLAPLADRVTEDVDYVLGRAGGTYVAPYDAVLAAGRSTPDAENAGRRLRVRTVASGGLQRTDTGFRVNLEMTDAVTGEALANQEVRVDGAAGEATEQRLALALFHSIDEAVDGRWMQAELARPGDDHDPQNVFARLRAIDGAGHPRDIAEGQRLVRVGRKLMATNPAVLAEFDAAACNLDDDLIQNRFYASAAQRAQWAAEALAYAEESERLRPGATSPHQCRAEVLGEIDRWDEALAEARYIIETIPMTANGYATLAEAEFGQGRFGDALKDWQELAHRGLYPAFNVGISRLFGGDSKGAVDELRRAEVQSPRSSETSLMLTAALELSGDHAGALAQAARYRALPPDQHGWWDLELSHAPAYLTAAAKVRAALSRVGLAPLKADAGA